MSRAITRRQRTPSMCDICGSSFHIPHWDRSLASLKNMAEQGCMRCKLFLESANAFADDWARDGHSGNEPVILSVETHFFTQQMRVFLSWPLVTGSRKKIEIIISGEAEYSLPWLEFPFRPLPSYDIQRRVKFIQSRMDSCDRHDGCNDLSLCSNRSPSRLLKIRAVNDALEVILIETSATECIYTAVSHCWGEAQNIPKTTRDNIQERLANWFSVSSLTRTFQDAVDLTRRLGLEYIWIDSLCIIQHDKDDWEKECRNMADVYGGAHLVISAAHAKDGNGGLYTAGVPFHRVEFQTRAGDTVRAVVTKEELQGTAQSHDMWRTGEQYWRSDRLPLFQRAWVFQERMLARRIIHFTSSELVWECRFRADCECGDLTDPWSAKFWPEFGPGKTVKTKYFDIARWGNDLQRLNFWHVMTAQFSARNITCHSDRLPALASTARQIDMPGMLGRYLCGIWEDTMPWGLLWWSEHTDTTRFPRQHPRMATHVRSKDASIPTWSWLSIEGRVSTWGRAPLTQIPRMDINYTLATDDTYGACKEGKIEVRALISPIKISITLGEDGSSQIEIYREGSPKRYPLISDTQPFEYSEEELSGLQVIALQFGMTHLFIESMILHRENERPTNCRRLGIADVSEELFQGCQYEDIVLT